MQSTTPWCLNEGSKSFVGKRTPSSREGYGPQKFTPVESLEVRGSGRAGFDRRGRFGIVLCSVVGRRKLGQIRQLADPPRGQEFCAVTSPDPRHLARTRRCALQLPSKCEPAPLPQHEGRAVWLPGSVRAAAPAIRRKPPEHSQLPPSRLSSPRKLLTLLRF